MSATAQAAKSAMENRTLFPSYSLVGFRGAMPAIPLTGDVVKLYNVCSLDIKSYGRARD